MKRWLGVLAIALLLCGCSKEAPPEIEESPTLPTVQSPVYSAFALYDPDNPIEGLTNGTVKGYLPKDGECVWMAPMGKNMLLYAGETITLLRGERMTEIAKAQIPDLPSPDSGMLQIKTDGIAYYNRAANQIVFLSQFFREVGIFSLPTEVVGGVYLTPDWQYVYYCTAAGVHMLDLDSGVSRLLKAQNGAWQGISGGFLNGTALRATVRQENGKDRTMLLSAETGLILAEGDYLATMCGSGDGYYAAKEGEHIFGVLDGQPRQLVPAADQALYPLPDDCAAVGFTKLENGGRLDYYDVAGGARTASVELPGITGVSGVYSINGAILFASEGAIYRWETAKNAVEDQRIYTMPRYYSEKPDTTGLAAIGRQLEGLEERFGVEILYWNEVQTLAPWEYQFTTEYLTEPYSASIYKLERALSKFPEDFFRKAAQWTTSGKLHIVLVRGIYAGAETEKYTSAPGIQYIADGEVYIALSLGEELESWFYHELGHVIDNRVLSTVNSYSQWNKLNPWDFKYDNDYEKNQNRTESKYLEGAKRYFVDLYSMSFAVEDRSRIFEYACMPGNEEVFASKYMQKKLKTVCDGIRRAFDLTEDTYAWEQYLQ